MGEGGTGVRACHGVSISSTRAPSAAAVARDLRAEIDPAGLAALLLFFSPHYAPDDLAREMAAAFPGVPVYGCTSAGELSLEGMSEASAVALGFPADEFTIVGDAIFDLECFSIEAGRNLVRDLRARLDAIPTRRDGEATFALTLIDGLCRKEERVVSALYPALDEIPLVGGSAGDDLRFERTFVLTEGAAHRHAALVLLVRTSRPFRVFKVDHFEPMAEKMVVTAAQAEDRRIYELNAEPAAQEYARAIGASEAPLDAYSFAAHPVVVRVGGEYYARSIQRVNEDGSLSFFCAIDEGLVLTAARPRHMIDSLVETFAAIEQDLGKPDFVLGFDCVLRRLDAAQSQITRELSAFYASQRVVGFNTYGEQYRSMHLNQTFTGVAFGPCGEPEAGK